MMMMMIMIASFVDSITTPIRLWLEDRWGEKKRMRVKVVVGCKSAVECIMCLSEVGLEERYAMVERCGHGFHVECVEAWLKHQPNCPLCRTPAIDVDDRVYLKKLYEILDTWLTSFFTLPALQSTLSESCTYL